MQRMLLQHFSMFLALFAGLAWGRLGTSPALASAGPVRTVTVAAGPYPVVIGISQDPPQSDTSFTVTVTPQGGAQGITGYLVAHPGLGTAGNATPHLPLTVHPDRTLATQVTLVVRGAWVLAVTLNGPQGAGTATMAITVAAPGAIPVWLGWVIGLSPLLGLLAFIFAQRRAYQTLQARQTAGK